MLLLPWQNAQVTRVADHNEHTRSFFLETDGGTQFDFKPGQFVTFDLPIADRPSQRTRSYSIASAPNGSTFEVVISHKPNGAGSSFFFDHAVPGQIMKFKGPQGKFVLPETFERPIVMICTGTGVAPFRSQIIHLLEQHIAVPEIHLVFGSRTEADALYFDEFNALTQKYPHFHYHVALSRAGKNWNGHHGYVHDLYKEICQNGSRDMDFYLCGWRMMVTEAKNTLAAMGYPSERVHLEVYD